MYKFFIGRHYEISPKIYTRHPHTYDMSALMNELSSIKSRKTEYSMLDNKFSAYLISLCTKFCYTRAAVSHKLQLTLKKSPFRCSLNNHNTVHVILIFNTMSLFN